MIICSRATIVPFPKDTLGKNLSIHPACGVLAEFAEQILPWKGIPQGYAIEELHEEGILYADLDLAMIAMAKSFKLVTR